MVTKIKCRPNFQEADAGEYFLVQVELFHNDIGFPKGFCSCSVRLWYDDFIWTIGKLRHFSFRMAVDAIEIFENHNSIIYFQRHHAQHLAI